VLPDPIVEFLARCSREVRGHVPWPRMWREPVRRRGPVARANVAISCWRVGLPATQSPASRRANQLHRDVSPACCFRRRVTSCRPGGVLFPRRSVARRSVARRPVGGRDVVESLMLSTSSLITSPRSPLRSYTFRVVSAVTRTPPSRSGRAASSCPWQRARCGRCSCRSTSCPR